MDRYLRLVSSGPGKQIANRLGLPAPVALRRFRPGDPVVAGPVLCGAADKGRLLEPAVAVLDAVNAPVVRADDELAPIGGLAEPPAGLVFDASGIADSSGLRAAYDFLHSRIRGLNTAGCGRLLVLGTPPDECADPRTAAAQQALEGLVRSAGKELSRGGTAQLVQVSEGAEQAMASTLRFLLSGRSAYVSGQVIRLDRPIIDATLPPDWERPLDGKVAVVTGAARGIGAEIARALARDGAHVLCLDVPAQGDALAAVAGEIGGSALQLDITTDDASIRLGGQLYERHGGVDVVVHNAGVLRDRTLAKLRPDDWDAVLAVNLTAQERLDAVLLEDRVLRENGRIVSIASISGIAGNRGQTNYATSKAGVIGRVRALARELPARGVTANAVAPGFIETAMTNSMPLVLREVGRRMNSLGQAGLPIDVAETVAWLASPGSYAVNGNVVRVCGQSLLGA